MKSLVWKYGLIGGLVSSLLGTLNWLLVAWPLGVNVSQTVGYISIAVSLLCIPFGVKYFRDKLNGGEVSFRQSFKIGISITTIAGLVMAVHSVVFFMLQKDEFLKWQRNSLSAEELEAFNQQIAQSPDFVYSPLFQGFVMFVMVFLIGIFINLLTAFFFKKSTY